MEFFRHSKEFFDVCIASGVLYHMKKPVELLDLISQKSSKVFLWTHYYDAKLCNGNPYLKPRFSHSTQETYKGLRFQHHVHSYKTNSWKMFYGGPASTSHWLKREDILEACRYFGFTKIQINHEEPCHCHGPCFALAASKT